MSSAEEKAGPPRCCRGAGWQSGGKRPPGTGQRCCSDWPAESARPPGRGCSANRWEKLPASRPSALKLRPLLPQSSGRCDLSPEE